MLVKHIWPALVELTGVCDEAVNYQALALGLDWLSNKQLFDPFVGYLDFFVSSGYRVALPREVKAPIRININDNPAFTRSRLFEFTMNTDGSAEGARLGWEWQNQGFTCVQDETPLPSRIVYICSDPADAGATVNITYKDSGGRTQTATLIAGQGEATPSIDIISKIEQVVRSKTAGECFLKTNPAGLTVARYYADEDMPEYRVIRLSQTASAIRMMFRRHAPQEFTSQEDVIPFHSRLAIIHAAKTVRLLQKGEYDMAAKSAEAAIAFAKDEQSSRDENLDLASQMDAASARNGNIQTLDELIVADVYDDASEIFGPIGRAKLFDKITLARQILSSKSNWDFTLGSVDIWKPDTSNLETVRGKGTGIFALPRYVGSVLAVAPCGSPAMPRNRWFEFHLNGTGESRTSGCGNWDELGTSPTCIDIPVDRVTKRSVPHKLAALPSSALDGGTFIRIYGIELDEVGNELEIMRDGKKGWLCPVTVDADSPAEDSPGFIRITGIEKQESKGFISLLGFPLGLTPDLLLGLYYPDDIRPRFRRIKVAQTKAYRIRVLYKIREERISSLNDPLHLRSKAAIVEMFRAMKMREADQSAADAAEITALRYLSEMERSDNPTDSLKLQFNSPTMPGGFRNIM